MPRYLTEFIGTFFLCLTIGLTVTLQFPLPALPIGAALMVMVYMGGPISGGHYNPAVSLAAYLGGGLPVAHLLPYMISQLLGALAAGVVTGVITGDIVSPMPSFDVHRGIPVLVEVLYTFALCLVVLNTAVSKRAAGNSYFGLAIGFTVMVGAAAGGSISGGAFNPAVGVGLGLIDGLMGGAPMGHLWIYLAGPFVGGSLAALVYKFQETYQAVAVSS